MKTGTIRNNLEQPAKAVTGPNFDWWAAASVCVGPGSGGPGSGCLRSENIQSRPGRSDEALWVVDNEMFSVEPSGLQHATVSKALTGDRTDTAVSSLIL